MSNPTRRALVRTGVWAVPAVATAAAAPAFAGTGSPCVTLNSVVSACKKGSSNYTVVLSFTACAASTVSIVSFAMTGTPATSTSPSSFSVASGTSSKSITVNEAGTPGSSATVTYSDGTTTSTTTVALGTVASSCH